ncbi:MAG: DUF2784 family protein [Candidatus Zixiibacteriota bacterium]
MYTKTGLVFGFSKNQILVAVILGQNSFGFYPKTILGCVYYWIAANLLVILHLGFVCFVVFGAFLVLKWRWIVFLHISAAVWGALMEW